MMNSRVRYQGKRGTVRYVGPVASDAKSTRSSISHLRDWLGIEWDKDGEGIHDGSCIDPQTGRCVRYFSCAPGRGSFVKPEKVSIPRTFHEAYSQRYQGVIEGQTGEVLVKTTAKTDLKTAGLEYSDVGLISWNDKENFSFIESLDLSGTLFRSWRELLSMASLLPSLKTLIVGDNAILERESGMERVSFPCLESLVLTRNCRQSVVHVLSILDAPKLKNLHLSHCGLLEIPSAIPGSTTEVDLSFNELSVLGESEIDRVKELSVLILNGNKQLKLDTDLSARLVRLERFCIEDTAMVSHWKHVDFLGSVLCPVLVDLRMWNVPLFQQYQDPNPSSDTSLCVLNNPMMALRARIIVRCPKLQRLNGTELDSKVRSEAELFCLKANDDFPGREGVARRHGLTIEDDSASSKPPSRSTLIALSFQDPASISKIVSRKLPLSTKLSHLYTVYTRLFAANVGPLDRLKLEFMNVALDRLVSIDLENSDRLTLAEVLDQQPSETQSLRVYLCSSNQE